ncbi:MULTISPECIES: DUF5374 domain-containing protein [unclassified Lonepinella]|uniref:DUF5374 domain-containing protein n=2 Tax=unclassified Lonepinella TaxID=2642006 RepID=UPI0036D809AF
MILFPKFKQGMGLVTLLVALSLFSGIFLAINQWANIQRKTASEIYQRYQAIQIAENQQQRQFLGLNCESGVEQNQLKFSINCIGDKVKVRYILGEISL